MLGVGVAEQRGQSVGVFAVFVADDLGEVLSSSLAERGSFLGLDRRVLEEGVARRLSVVVRGVSCAIAGPLGREWRECGFSVLLLFEILRLHALKFKIYAWVGGLGIIKSEIWQGWRVRLELALKC